MRSDQLLKSSMEPRWLYNGETYLMESQLKDEKKKKKVTVTVSLNKTGKKEVAWTRAVYIEKAQFLAECEACEATF